MRTTAFLIAAGLAIFAVTSSVGAREDEESSPIVAAGSTGIRFDVHVIEVPATRVHRLLGASLGRSGMKMPWTPPSDPARIVHPKTVREIPWRDAARILRCLAPCGGKVCSTWRGIVLEDQAYVVDEVRRLSYVQDFEVEVGKGGERLSKPLIGTLQEGVALQIRGRRAANAKGRLEVDLDGFLATAIRPIPDFHTRVGGKPVKIQLPELRLVQPRGRYELADGGVLLVGLPMGTARGDTSAPPSRVALVRVKTVMIERMIGLSAPGEFRLPATDR